MEEKEYVELLDRVYTQLPENLSSSKRFEIPKASGKIIRSRTQISNFNDIAKKFSRDTDHFSRYMLKELGVRGELDGKGQLMLHSKFQPAMLNKAIEKYFHTYVECPNCKSPDTELLEDNSVIKCNACGHQDKVPKL